MNDVLIDIAEQNGGYLWRHQLNDLGHGDPWIKAMVRAGELVRVRHGTYVVGRVWAVLDPAQRHAVITRSILDKLGPGVVASHQSSAALHGLDLFGIDLSAVHVTRLDGRNGRTEAGVVFHSGRLEESACVEVDGRLATEPARTALEIGMTSSIEAGVVLISSVLRRGAADKQALEEDVERDFARWQGVRTARIALRLSDARLESAGEARSLYMMWRHRIPAPELQVTVLDERGRPIGRSDFEWSAFCHLGEFDGMIKYGRLNPFSTDPGRQIEREKVREDRMRGTGRGMTRWGWDGLGARGAETARRLLADMERSRRLYLRNATHIA